MFSWHQTGCADYKLSEVELITWAEIDNEVEEFQNGYRSGFVAIFKKYEGNDTDERDASNRVIKVTKASFSRRYGISETTFRGWLDAEVGTTTASTSRGTINDRMAEAAAKATAEAEAKAAKELAAALARQEKAQREAMLAQKQEQERAAKAEASRIRAEEQAKAKEAAAKEIAALKVKLAEEAKKAEFDLSTLTEADKAKVMTILANDPEKAAEYFKAANADRARKNAEATERNRQEAERKQKQASERDQRKAADRARADYDGSALKLFVKLANEAKSVKEKLNNKPVTFDHILTSGMSAHEWVAMTDFVEDLAVEIREAIFSANAESQLQDISE